jgi:hypothetical protein
LSGPGGGWPCRDPEPEAALGLRTVLFAAPRTQRGRTALLLTFNSPSALGPASLRWLFRFPWHRPQRRCFGTHWRRCPDRHGLVPPRSRSDLLVLIRGAVMTLIGVHGPALVLSAALQRGSSGTTLLPCCGRDLRASDPGVSRGLERLHVAALCGAVPQPEPPAPQQRNWRYDRSG